MVKIKRSLNLCVLFIVIKCIPGDCFPLIIPEDVSTGSAVIYGFSPKVIFGNDHRAGFGFRFGNHADFQIMYEFGPQAHTKPLQPIRVRSAAYRQRVVRRRPLIEFLVKSGLLDLKHERIEFDVEAHGGNRIDEPR